MREEKWAWEEIEPETPPTRVEKAWGTRGPWARMREVRNFGG